MLVNGVLWTASAAPTLTGTVVDVNLRDLRALIGGNLVATAMVTGNTWTMTLPAGAVPTMSDVTIDLVARDLADKTVVKYGYLLAPIVPMLAGKMLIAGWRVVAPPPGVRVGQGGPGESDQGRRNRSWT